MQTQPDTIDPTGFPKDHPMSVALRLIGRHWQLCHSKLMSLSWEWTTVTPYGATDGKRLVLNRDGLNKLNRQKDPVGLTAFLLVHEALHALLGHGWRLAKLPDSDRANRAADYVINAMIADRNQELRKELRISYDVFPLIDGVLLDRQLSGNLSAEQLYRKLASSPKPQPPQPQPAPQDADGGEGEADSDEGAADGEAEGAADSDEADGAADGAAEGAADGGEAEGAADGAADGDEGGDGGEGAADGDDLSDFVGTGADDNLDPTEDAADAAAAEQIVDEIEQSNDSVMIAEDLRRRQSNEGSSQLRDVNAQRKPEQKLPWTDLLRDYLQRNSRTGWNAPFSAPVFSSSGLIAAGRSSRKAGDIVLVIDTSGSVTDSDLKLFLSEAQAILDELKPDRLHLLSVSHKVMQHVELTEGDTVPERLNGGGGTLFLPAFDFVQQHGIDPEALVYLTDGYASDFNELRDPHYPTLWVSTSLPAHCYPFGQAITTY